MQEILDSTDAVRRPLDQGLAREIRRQNETPSCTVAQNKNLNALVDPDLGVVTTGQQVGLFLGPAYTLYKAATAVALAKRIERHTGKPTVPVFWLQSEDHDADEVATCTVLNADGCPADVRLGPTGDERASMADRVLGHEVGAAVTALASHLPVTPYVDSVIELLRSGYRANVSWVGSFAAVLAQLFADEGLLMFDPRAPPVSVLAKPIHRRALERAPELDNALEQGAAILQDVGQAIGVRPRAGCSLCFYHPDGETGPRFRLVDKDGGWQVPGSDVTHTTSALLERLETHPREFSTSGLLRVVLQQTLFPAIAQVAGPSESQYLRQVPPLCAAYGVTTAAVVMRAKLVVTDEDCRRRLESLGVRAAEVGEREALLGRLASADEGISGEDVATLLRQASDRQLEALAAPLDAIDPELQKALKRTRDHFGKGAKKLGERVDRARARRNQTRVEQVDWICQRLRPRAAPQERVLGGVQFLARHGVGPFKAALMEAVERHLDDIARGDASRLHEVAL